MCRKVGRPKNKIDKIKIGLFIDKKINNKLKDLTLKHKLTKSQIVEKALINFYKVK